MRWLCAFTAAVLGRGGRPERRHVGAGWRWVGGLPSLPFQGLRQAPQPRAVRDHDESLGEILGLSQLTRDDAGMGHNPWLRQGRPRRRPQLVQRGEHPDMALAIARGLAQTRDPSPLCLRWPTERILQKRQDLNHPVRSPLRTAHGGSDMEAARAEAGGLRDPHSNQLHPAPHDALSRATCCQLAQPSRFLVVANHCLRLCV